MGRSPSTFKKADLTRATKAIQAAGLDIARVKVSRDVIVLVLGQFARGCSPVQPDAGSGGAVQADDLDRELAEFNARHDQD